MMAPPIIPAPIPAPRPHPPRPRHRTVSIFVGVAFLRARPSAGIADALFVNGTMLMANIAAEASIDTRFLMTCSFSVGLRSGRAEVRNSYRSNADQRRKFQSQIAAFFVGGPLKW